MKRKLTCTNYFIILEKRFSREHTLNTNANVQARQDVTFWAVRYCSPRVPTSFSDIVCKIGEHNYVQKDEFGLGGGVDVLKIFFLFPICIIQKVTILAPK